MVMEALGFLHDGFCQAVLKSVQLADWPAPCMVAESQLAVPSPNLEIFFGGSI